MEISNSETGGANIARQISAPQALAHTSHDNVAVVVVEDLQPGAEILIVATEDDSSFSITTKQAIQIGHKIALKDFVVGDTVIKYGEDIGKIVANVKAGEHVHVHNLKTKRW